MQYWLDLVSGTVKIVIGGLSVSAPGALMGGWTFKRHSQ
jgi:hypothetical protein